MDDTKYTTQLDHGTYVKIWVCPAGVHTFIHTYLGYSQYSLYIYIYIYICTHICWYTVGHMSHDILLYYTIFFFKDIFHCIPTISRCISIIYIYFSIKFRTNMALRPRNRFPNAKRRRTAWALAARGKDEQYVDPLVSNTSEMCESSRGFFGSTISTLFLSAKKKWPVDVYLGGLAGSGSGTVLAKCCDACSIASWQRHGETKFYLVVV